MAGFLNQLTAIRSSMGNNNNIHIGTSGWSYKHWKDIYYPNGLKSRDYLSYYAKEFHTAEINTSFYRLPKENTIEKWLQEVPESFTFCPKMSRYLSHMKKLHDATEPVERFCGIFDKMKERIGLVLIQLPDIVRFNNGLTEEFYQILKTKPDYRFAMEVRHDSWFSDESIYLLNKYGVALVFAQSKEFPYFEAVTAKDIYVRFHGPDNLYGSSYSDSFLADYAEKIRKWESEGHHIWIYFNNDIHGFAFQNARTLIEMLGLA